MFLRRLYPLVIVVILLSSFGFMKTASAACTVQAPSDFVVGSQIGGGKLIDDCKQSEMDEAVDDAGIMDGFVMGQANNLFKIPGVNSLQNLVFGNPYPTWGFNGDNTNTLNYGIFYDSELTKVLRPLMSVFGGAYVSILTLAIMISSLRFGMKAYSPQAKSDFWTDINMYVFSAFFIAAFWPFFGSLMSANQAIVSAIGKTLIAQGISINGVSIIAGADGFKASDVLVFLAEWGLALYLNVIYISRKLIIILLVVLSPVAAYSLLFAKTRAFFGTWVKELAGNIFLQSIHGIVLYVFCMLASIMDGSIGAMVFKLGMIIMFIPITGMVSKWLNLGDSSSKVGSAATMMGAGSIAGAMMLAKGAGGIMSGAKGNFNQMLGGGMLPSGGDALSSDSTSTAISKAASGGTGWSRAKSVMSGLGGVMGGTMGLSMGPAGVMLGAKLGSSGMRGAMQGARNVGSGVINAGKSITGEHGFKGLLSPGVLAERFNNLEERRNTLGNLGESLGSMVGKGTMGRNMGQALSGVSRNRLHAADTSKGGYGGLDLSDLQKQHPGASARWEQTNEGSRFLVDAAGNGSYTPMGPMGAADTNLKKGEVRAADFQLRPKDEAWQRGANGSYTVERANGTQPGAPITAANGQPLLGANGQPLTSTGAPRTQREVAGFSGSTESFGRKSDAYIMGSDGKKFNDTNFDASKINPDSYFAHNVQGADRRTGSDKAADILHRSSGRVTQAATHTRTAGAWAASAIKDKVNSRYKGAV